MQARLSNYCCPQRWENTGRVLRFLLGLRPAICATPSGQCQGRGMKSRPMIRTASMDAHGRLVKAMRIAKPG